MCRPHSDPTSRQVRRSDLLDRNNTWCCTTDPPRWKVSYKFLPNLTCSGTHIPAALRQQRSTVNPVCPWGNLAHAQGKNLTIFPIHTSAHRGEEKRTPQLMTHTSHLPRKSGLHTATICNWFPENARRVDGLLTREVRWFSTSADTSKLETGEHVPITFLLDELIRWFFLRSLTPDEREMPAPWKGCLLWYARVKCCSHNVSDTNRCFFFLFPPLLFSRRRSIDTGLLYWAASRHRLFFILASLQMRTYTFRYRAGRRLTGTGGARVRKEVAERWKVSL